MLMAAVVLGLSWGVTSCKDDDDDKSEQRNEDADPLDTDEAQVAWRWLSALTSAQTLESNWTTKSYEPTVGVASENNENTRIVVVANIGEAKAKFADLADVNVSRLGNEYTVSQAGVGKMTWTPSKEGAQNLAEVAVDTKLIPHLQKIVYCTQDQVGVNGWLSTNVEGTAYYRFGDVIKSKTTGQYWVCVRPSFEQHDKGDSHWMCIFNDKVDNGIPEANLYKKYNKVAKYNNRTIILPTKLKYKREHLNNLTNLVFALLDPSKYAKKVGTANKENGLGGFDYKYHGEKFLTNVAMFWDLQSDKGKNIWEILFNCSHEDMKYMKNMILLYQGYQWRIGTTGYVWEFKASRDDGFQLVTPGSESEDKVLYDFGNKGYDVTRYCSNSFADNMTDGPKQFYDTGDYRWVVTYATGDDLMANGKYSPYEQLNGFEDIYRYNEKTNIDAHDPVVEENKVSVLRADDDWAANDNSETWNKTNYEGASHYHVGDVYQDNYGSKWIVTLMSGESSEKSPYTELVSFDVTVKNDKSQFESLPSRDRNIRGALALWHLNKSVQAVKDRDLTSPMNSKAVMAAHVLEYAKVDLRHILQFVEKTETARAHSELFTFPVRSEASKKQRMIRLIEETDNPRQDMTIWLWEHYPKNPSTTEQKVTSFSTDSIIYMQDVADQNLVTKYAKDFYATRRIVNGEQMGDIRSSRSQKDDKALDMTNYIYKYEDWKQNKYPVGMWNEPILAFRTTAIYDRGDKDYASKTVDGLRLKPVHCMTLVGADMFDGGDKDITSYEFMRADLRGFYEEFMSASKALYLDGKEFTIPSWEIWK